MSNGLFQWASERLLDEPGENARRTGTPSSRAREASDKASRELRGMARCWERLAEDTPRATFGRGLPPGPRGGRSETQISEQEPFVGVRAWALADSTAERHSTRSPVTAHAGLSGVGSGIGWTGRTLQAVCSSGLRGDPHEPPDEDCSCGVWVASTWDLVTQYLYPGVVCGVISTWGRMVPAWPEIRILHRAQFGRIECLATIYPQDAALLEVVAKRFEVPVVKCENIGLTEEVIAPLARRWIH